MIVDSYRDQEWLENLLSDIWFKHFLDVEQTNRVHIRYGRKAKNRLGSISMDRKNQSDSVITVNSIYKDLRVPEYVIRATIVHELCHYAHGFNSPHSRKHKHPHSGGVIRKEFAERGLEKLYDKQRDWLKENWAEVIGKYFNLESRPRNRRTRSTKPRLSWWTIGI